MPKKISILSRRILTPIIPFKQDYPLRVGKTESQSYTLRTDPTTHGSPTYELNVPYFKGGTVEDLLTFLKTVDRVLVGQNATQPPNCFNILRGLLQGDPLAAFNRAALINGDDTEHSFKLNIHALVEHLIPKRALVTQKRYMRRILRKPLNVTVREFMSRLIELNEYLPYFPPYDADQKLSQEELLDICEFAVPFSWQKTMVVQGFDPISHSPAEFIEFCERLEFAEQDLRAQQPEVLPQNDSQGRKGRLFSASKSLKKGNDITTNNKRKYDHNTDQPYCEYHRCHSHSTGQCKVVLEQVKRMRNTWDGNRTPNTTNNSTNSPNKHKDWKTGKKPTTKQHSEHLNFETQVKKVLEKILAEKDPDEENPTDLELENSTEFNQLRISEEDSEDSE
jgi:hypothetical protein